MIKRGHAIAPLADGADELPSLVVAEGLHGIADGRIARRIRALEELGGHGPALIGLATRREEHLVRRMQAIDDRGLLPVQFGQIVVALRTVALAQLAHLEDACGAACKLGNPRDPIFHVLRWARLALAGPIPRHQLLGRAAHSLYRPQQILGKIKAVNTHIAQLARACLAFVLPPANGALSPVLQALETGVANRPQNPGLHQVADVVNRRYKAIGKRRHVATPRRLAPGVDFPRLGKVHAQGLLAQHVAASV